MILRDYQIQISSNAAGLLKEYNIAYLSMQVRTGKTLTALAAADKYGARKVLFVTKKKAIASIMSDYDSLAPSFNISVINYEQLHNVFLPDDYDLIIVDEAHSLGQYPTPAERTKLLKKICVGKPIIYLSGTPSPESYSQLYHQFYISSHSPFKQWPTFYKWAAEFVTMRKKYFFNRQINCYDDADKDKIDTLCAHLFLSYTQEEAGFLKQVEEEILTVRMHETTYALAKKLQTKRIHIGQNGEEILADTAVKCMNKMHQIFSGTVLTEDGQGIAFDHTKAKFIKTHFAGKKIAIFYKFKAEGMMLVWTFGVNNLTADPEEFENSDKIFYSQIQSGREGISLASADALVMMNIDYSSLSYQQARARIQAKDKNVRCPMYWIFSEGGIEHKIYERVINKQDYTLNYFKKDFVIAEYDPNVKAIIVS